MITYVLGNLFESPAKVLVNTVNTEGVMGKGIAKEFKTIFPDMFKQYQKLCEKKKIDIGILWLYRTSNKWILNFPTKTTWRKPSKLEYIEQGLKKFVAKYDEHNITSIAFPPLGCGNGELDFDKQVRPLMEKYLKPLPIDIYIHLYNKEAAKPEHKDIKVIRDWLRSEPRSLSFSEVWDDLGRVPNVRIEKNTISGTSEVLSVTIDETDEYEILYYEHAEKKVSIAKDDIYQLWSTLRYYGFLYEKQFPNHLIENYDTIVELFLNLPYIEKTPVTKDYNSLSKNSSGIKLSEAKLSDNQKELFELSA